MNKAIKQASSLTKNRKSKDTPFIFFPLVKWSVVLVEGRGLSWVKCRGSRVRAKKLAATKERCLVSIPREYSGRFHTNDVLSVWTNWDRHLQFAFLCASSLKTGKKTYYLSRRTLPRSASDG